MSSDENAPKYPKPQEIYTKKREVRIVDEIGQGNDSGSGIKGKAQSVLATNLKRGKRGAKNKGKSTEQSP